MNCCKWLTSRMLCILMQALCDLSILEHIIYSEERYYYYLFGGDGVSVTRDRRGGKATCVEGDRGEA